jgi:hypothetical protein
MKDQLLLDNQSTTDIFANAKYLKNIRATNRTLSLVSNGGVLEMNLVAEFPGYSTVWYDP